MTTSSEAAEFRDLLDAYCEGTLSAEQFARLQAGLVHNADLRRRFVLCVQVQAAVERSLTALLSDAEGTPISAQVLKASAAKTKLASPGTPASPVLGFLGGAMDYVNHSRTMMFWLVALLVGGWFAFQLGSLMLGRAHPGGAQVVGRPADPNSPDVSHPPGGSFANTASPRQSDLVASVTTLVDCHWRVVPPAAPPASAPTPGDADTTGPIRDDLFHVGSELSAGQQLNLVHGLAEITFRSGARIVLNGPAHFTIGSPLGGKLQVGKLTARVPHEAHGFTVKSPAGEVVDLGTEFGVAVAADHTMAVEVFVGQVAVDSSAVGQTPGPSETVTAGHAVRVMPGKPVVSIPLDPNRFVRGLGPREDSKIAQAAYLDFVRSLKPVAWFRMEGQDTDRVLHDEMGNADATLFWNGPGNPFVAGRTGKCLWLRGSELKDGAVARSYPQAEHGKLSVVAWAYADSFPLKLSTVAANWNDWHGGGQFFFGLQATHGSKNAVLVASIARRSGQPISLVEPAEHPFPLREWQHIAFTTDGATLRLYRQGREVAAMKHAGLQYPVLLQSLGVGVKPSAAGDKPRREDPDNWDGKLDEIAIFNDVLSADDIHKMAESPP